MRVSTSSTSSESDQATPHVLWDDAPGETYGESYLIGNGRLGAAVAGSPLREKLALNEDSLWSSGPMDRVNPDARAHLGELRDLVRGHKQREAFTLASRAMGGIPQSMANYEYLGGLILQMDTLGRVDKYTRQLDLDTATAKVSFEMNGVTYTRECLASRPDNVIAIHLCASSGALNFGALIERGEALNRREASNEKLGSDTVVMTGTVGNHGRIEYAAGFAVVSDGKVSTLGRTVVVQGATQATVYLSSWTNYRQANPRSAVARDLAAAKAKEYEEIKHHHVADYRALFGRVELDLGRSSPAQRTMTTAKRIAALKNEFDAELVSTYFQFGRYLLLSSSRQGTLPANLQGIWSHSVEPDWGSKYTININLREQSVGLS